MRSAIENKSCVPVCQRGHFPFQQGFRPCEFDATLFDRLDFKCLLRQTRKKKSNMNVYSGTSSASLSSLSPAVSLALEMSGAFLTFATRTEEALSLFPTAFFW